MSIIGEHRSAMAAKKLEGIILRAMNDGQYGCIRSAVKGFCKYELVEWYYNECADSYGLHYPNPTILEHFPRKKD